MKTAQSQSRKDIAEDLRTSLVSAPLTLELLDQLCRKTLEIGGASPADGLALARELWARCQPAQDPALRARAALTLGQALNRAERYAEAFRTLVEAGPLLESLALTRDTAHGHQLRFLIHRRVRGARRESRLFSAFFALSAVKEKRSLWPRAVYTTCQRRWSGFATSCIITS